MALLVLLWATGGVVAGPPAEGPEGDVSIAATVGSKISYQGVLKESGSLVTGSRDMTFRLYSDDTCSTQVGSDIVKSGVQVTDGLFSVDLAVTHSDFNGQGLWLEVGVGGTKIGCQELLPVPYALSLRPRAVISGTVSGGAILHAENTASAGRGLRGYATATSGTNYGVVGASTSPDGYGGYFYNTASGGTGLYARGIDTGADLVLAGNANTTVGDDGRIFSDPAYTSSDIWLISNDGVRIDLDENGDGEDANFEIRDKDNNLIFNVDESSGVYGYSGGSGDGVHGEATALNKSGVYGHSTDGFGVTGRSTNNDGVAGYSNSAGKSGVYGYNETAYGVFGRTNSVDGYGVLGKNNTTTGVGTAGFMSGYSPGDKPATWWKPAGLFGGRNGIVAFTKDSNGVGVVGHCTATSGSGCRGIHARTDSSSGWAGNFDGSGNGVYISVPAGKKGLEVASGTKSAVVGTADGSRLLYSEEATEVWFADYGFGRLQDGLAVVPIDPIFARTVNLEELYHVFIQTYGNAEVYVTNRTPTQFEVRLRDGDPNSVQ